MYDNKNFNIDITNMVTDMLEKQILISNIKYITDVIHSCKRPYLN